MGNKRDFLPSIPKTVLVTHSTTVMRISQHFKYSILANWLRLRLVNLR